MKKLDLNKTLERIKTILFFIYILFFYIFGADSMTVKYSEIILIIFLVLEGYKIIKEKGYFDKIINNQIMTIEELQKKGLNVKISKKEVSIEK